MLKHHLTKDILVIVTIISFRNAFFHPTNLGSELESALEEGGLGSLEEEVGDDEADQGGGLRGRSLERARKVSMLERSGRRFLETSRSPFRHSFVDVRVDSSAVQCSAV